MTLIGNRKMKLRQKQLILYSFRMPLNWWVAQVRKYNMAIINRIRILLHLDRVDIVHNADLNNMLGIAGKQHYLWPHNDFERVPGIAGGGCLMEPTHGEAPHLPLLENGHYAHHFSPHH